MQKLEKRRTVYLTKKRFRVVDKNSIQKSSENTPKIRKGYLRSSYSVKSFGENYKVFYSGDSRWIPPVRLDDCKHYDRKLEQSIARAKRTIMEKALCNDWDFFFTGTVNPEKLDGFDLDELHKELTKFFSYKNQKHGKVDFLIVPERHKSGQWHFHGLLRGVLPSDIVDFKFLYRQKYDRLPNYILKKIHNNEPCYEYTKYAEKFGFCNLEPIKSHEAVSKYITKYCNKELASRADEIGKHLYFCSRGLKKAEQVAKFDLWSKKNYDGDNAMMPDAANELRPEAFPFGWHEFYREVNGSEIFLGCTAVVTPQELQKFQSRWKNSVFFRKKTTWLDKLAMED